MKMIELTLPPFAILSGWGSDNELKGRNVILHVRSASVIEVFERGKAFLNEDVITLTRGNLVFALHHSPLLDLKADRELIIEHIMKPTADYWRDYNQYKRLKDDE